MPIKDIFWLYKEKVAFLQLFLLLSAEMEIIDEVTVLNAREEFGAM